MVSKIILPLTICLCLFIVGCSKDDSSLSEAIQSESMSVSSDARGATQISALGVYATTDECSSSQGQGAAYIVKLAGDINGCLYAFIDDFDCSPSGTYREEGRELFIGTYNGETGSFWTTYKFESKFEGCSESGAPLGLEIFGRCQHPIVAGSGTGVFEGVTGRIDMKDDVEAGNFPMRGHLRFR